MEQRDFLGVDVNGGRPKKPTMERKKSFREISRMSPDVIRSVMAITSCSSPTTTTKLPLPSLLLPSSSRSKGDNTVTPFTIFYNGSVLAFDLTNDKAEIILKLAEGKEIDGFVDERNN